MRRFQNNIFFLFRVWGRHLTLLKKTTIHLQSPEFPDDPLKTDRRLINPVLFIGHLQIPQNWQVIYSNEAIYHKNNQIDLRFCPPSARTSLQKN
jgi:hypothetical protein